MQHTKCSVMISKGFDGGCPPRSRAYIHKPYRAVKHLYMFVIDAGVVVLHQYGIGGTLRCKVKGNRLLLSHRQKQSPAEGK